MDIKWIALLMLVLYIIPELFKRRPKQYEYPEVPQPTLEQKKETPVFAKEIVWSQPPLKPQEVKPMPETTTPVQLIDLPGQAGAWQGNLSQASIINGFIFAEVLQPPRALRPLETKYARPGLGRNG